MKTLIAVPCMDMVAAGFSQSLAMLHRVGDCLVTHLAGSLVYDSRNKIAAMAVQHECDFVMWFDSDMVFEPDTLERLMKHMESHDIVSGVYYRRTGTYKPVLYKELNVRGDGTVEAVEFDELPKEDLFKADGVGFGCVLMKTSVLIDMIMNEKDWFTPIGRAGEDLSFCLRAKKLGYEIWCDQTLRLGHVGQVIVTKEFFNAFSTAKEKQNESKSNDSVL